MENFNITYDEVVSLVKNMCTTISPDALALMRQAVPNQCCSRCLTMSNKQVSKTSPYASHQVFQRYISDLVMVLT